MKNALLHILLITTFLVGGVHHVFAQEDQASEENVTQDQAATDEKADGGSKEDESNKENSKKLSTKSSSSDDEYAPTRQRKFITLTLGIEHDEKLPPLPEKFVVRGDFKKITKAERAKEINTIRFTPTAEGVATLTIHDAKGRVIVEYRLDVKKSKLDRVAYEIRSLLADIDGISIKVANNKVLVDGQIILPKDLNRIASVIEQYGEQAASLVSLSPVALKKIAEFIARDINNPEVEVRAVNDYIILQGMVSSPEEKDRAVMIAKLYLPDVMKQGAERLEWIRKRKPANDGLIDLIQVKAAAPPPPSKMVQVVVHYVELAKDYDKAFRFQFTPGIKNDASSVTFGSNPGGGGLTSTIAATIDNLLPKLNWAKSHGHARVLESASIIVQDGKKGEMKSISNVPYQVTQATGQSSTSFVEVGIKSGITPVILGERSDSINMDMDFSLSNLVGQTAAGPLTSNNNIQTSLIVRSGQSAAIGGLITNSTSTGYNRAPPGSNPNPIISILASKEFQRKQSQFVVFVTPIIKSSASAGSEKIKKKFRLRD